MGATHIIQRKVDGAEILRRVECYGVTAMCGAPAVLNMILDAAEDWDGEVPGRRAATAVRRPARGVAAERSARGWG